MSSVFLSMQEAGRKAYDQYGLGSRTLCPVCNGGSTRERTLVVFEGDSGDLLAMCHRATCASSGVPYRLNTRPDENTAAKRPEFKRLPTSLLEANRDTDLKKLKDWKYLERVGATYLFYHAFTTDTRIGFPMRDPDGYERGVVLRAIDPEKTKPKVLTYKNSPDYSGMSWYVSSKACLDYEEVYVVEDPISAICLSQEGLPAVSLNGTSLSRQRVDELLDYKWRIVLMLDADATALALKYRRRYGPDVIRVIRLQKDIKDSTREEVRALLCKEE